MTLTLDMNYSQNLLIDYVFKTQNASEVTKIMAICM